MTRQPQGTVHERAPELGVVAGLPVWPGHRRAPGRIAGESERDDRGDAVAVSRHCPAGGVIKAHGTSLLTRQAAAAGGGGLLQRVRRG
jgi:hypothetical protein